MLSVMQLLLRGVYLFIFTKYVIHALKLMKAVIVLNQLASIDEKLLDFGLNL